MATEPPKSAPTTQEHSFPPIAPYPHQHFNTGTYPPPAPPGAYPPYFAYPPSSDGNHADSNGQNGVPPGPPYMMAYPSPHGMVYAYPPQPGQGFAVPQGTSVPQVVSRPKRKQVKMACTNCAAACKRCDEARPCERCLKYGVAESCVDGQRKERKKGVKRGPYKRKNKPASGDSSSFGDYPPPGPEGEWQPGTQPPTTASTTTAVHAAVAQYTTPEGYYPVYYPPPGPFMPSLHEGQPGQEGSTPHGNAQPPIVPYYIHPGGYPPYPHYPHPGSAYPPHGGPPPPSHALDSAEPTKKSEEAGGGGSTEDADGAAVRQKRTRAPKAKKMKISPTRWPKVVKAHGEAAHEPDQEYGEPVATSA